MTNILSNGYKVLNQIAPSGVAVAGTPGSGTLCQYNNGQSDTISAGDASKDGSVKKVIATDNSDTVNLGSGWTSAGTATDQTTGITGTLYTSNSGDQLLISGGATVNPSPSATPSASPAPSATPSASPGASPSASPSATPSPGATPAASPSGSTNPYIKTTQPTSYWTSLADRILGYYAPYGGSSNSYSPPPSSSYYHSSSSYYGGYSPSPPSFSAGGDIGGYGGGDYFAPDDLGEI